MLAYDKLHKLLRLACKDGGGYPSERQTALNKAIEHAEKHEISLASVVYELQVNIFDLSHSLNLFTKKTYRTSVRSKSRRSRANQKETIAGIYAVAGFQYYEGPSIKIQFRLGDPIRLIALNSNPYDEHAVVIYWKTYMIGYIPRHSNFSIWSALLAEQPLNATIYSVGSHNSYGAVQIEIH